MNKTIETAWKEGFLDAGALVAPQVNDLYGRKSEQTIDNVLRKLRWNYIAFVVVAVIMLMAAFLTGSPYAGIVNATALCLWAAHTRTHVLRMASIDRTSDSYHYVRAFNESIAAYLSSNVWAFRFATPAILLSWNEIILPSDADIATRVPMFVIAGLLFVFAGPASRFDENLFYKRVFERLREMQAEMEELRAADG